MGKLDLKNTLDQAVIDGIDRSYFDGGVITEVQYVKAKRKVIVHLDLPAAMPLTQLKRFSDGLIRLIGCPVELRISTQRCTLDSGEILEYLKSFGEQASDGSWVHDAVTTLTGQTVECLFSDEQLRSRAETGRDELVYFMQNAGISYDFEFRCRQASFTQIEVKIPQPQGKPSEPVKAEKPAYRKRRTKPDDFPVLKLKAMSPLPFPI